MLRAKIFSTVLNPYLTMSNVNRHSLQELDADFNKVKSEKPTVQRYLRSQQTTQSKFAQNDDEDIYHDALEAEAIDSTSTPAFGQAVDILSQLPKHFYKKIVAKEWQERKETLNALEQLLTNAHKLASGNYENLINALKKCSVEDMNYKVISTAANCLVMLIDKLMDSPGFNEKTCVLAEPTKDTKMEKGIKSSRKYSTCELSEKNPSIVLTAEGNSKRTCNDPICYIEKLQLRIAMSEIAIDSSNDTETKLKKMTEKHEDVVMTLTIRHHFEKMELRYWLRIGRTVETFDDPTISARSRWVDILTSLEEAKQWIDKYKKVLQKGCVKPLCTSDPRIIQNLADVIMILYENLSHFIHIFKDNAVTFDRCRYMTESPLHIFVTEEIFKINIKDVREKRGKINVHYGKDYLQLREVIFEVNRY
ncbi:uncharacterized protein LOC135845982 isoform X2 [Planococcus citri]